MKKNAENKEVKGVQQNVRRRKGGKRIGCRGKGVQQNDRRRKDGKRIGRRRKGVQQNVRRRNVRKRSRAWRAEAEGGKPGKGLGNGWQCGRAWGSGRRAGGRQGLFGEAGAAS